MIKDDLKQAILEAVKKAYPTTKLGIDEIEVEDSKNPNFGDLSSNVGFKLAKDQSLSPKETSEEVAKSLAGAWPFSAVSFNGTEGGYLNFRYNYQYYLEEILTKKEKFGDLDLLQNRKIQIEFISANPTGPLTLANGRGGFGGDVLANVMVKAGAQVQREYLVNDGGNQVRILGDSVLVVAGLLKKEEDVYRGEYIEEWVKNHKDDCQKLKDKPQELGRLVANDILENYIKKSVTGMKIKFDNWFSEQKLIDSGEVDKALADFKKRDLTYEKDEALWFKTTRFGDDKDRVLRKSGGENTYFANDAAYHWDKFAIRKFDRVINFWGADHHGYVGRMQAATEAMGFKGQLEIVIMQLVRLIEGGKEVRMSKRQGNYVTMDDLFEMIGGKSGEASDVARFFFLSRSFNTHMDFDLSLAKEHSDKNPVFYVKYAFARLSSILNKVEDLKLPKAELSMLKEKAETELIRELIRLPQILEDIVSDKSYPVHFLTFYSQSVATKFHAFYDQCRVIDEENLELTAARLELVKATRIVLRIVMEDLIGIEAPERM